MYSCQPVSAGSAGCTGGPVWSSQLTDAVVHEQDDPTLTFPAYCTAYVPDCSPYYIGLTRQFVCSGEGSSFGWGEQL